MQRVALEDRGHRQPVLKELRGQLDEIARDRRPGERGVGDVRQEPVQRVAELVEQGARVVHRQERRLAPGGLGEVADVVDHGRLAAVDPVLRRSALIQAPERLEVRAK